MWTPQHHKTLLNGHRKNKQELNFNKTQWIQIVQTHDSWNPHSVTNFCIYTWLTMEGMPSGTCCRSAVLNTSRSFFLASLKAYEASTWPGSIVRRSSSLASLASLSASLSFAFAFASSPTLTFRRYLASMSSEVSDKSIQKLSYLKNPSRIL